MDRALDSLSSDFRLRIDRILARLVEAGVPVMIVQTLRTVEEHTANLSNGTSRAINSKHLPRHLRHLGIESQTADAIDLCPYDLYQIHGPDKLAWNEQETPESVAAFALIGKLGEAEGLRWGGRWHDPHDPGHLEYLFTGERYKDIPSTSAAYFLYGIKETA